jgi:hypothetical protein
MKRISSKFIGVTCFKYGSSREDDTQHTHNMSNVSIKLVLDNEIRRFALTQASYEELVDTVQTIVPSVNATPSLSFVDDESDLCSITNSVELHEAIRLSSQVHCPFPPSSHLLSQEEF